MKIEATKNGITKPGPQTGRPATDLRGRPSSTAITIDGQPANPAKQHGDAVVARPVLAALKLHAAQFAELVDEHSPSAPTVTVVQSAAAVAAVATVVLIPANAPAERLPVAEQAGLRVIQPVFSLNGYTFPGAPRWRWVSHVWGPTFPDTPTVDGRALRLPSDVTPNASATHVEAIQ